MCIILHTSLVELLKVVFLISHPENNENCKTVSTKFNSTNKNFYFNPELYVEVVTIDNC